MLRTRIYLALTLLATGSAGCGEPPAAAYLEQPGAAADVLKIAYSYSSGGRYLLRDTGVPEDIRHKGALILPKDPRGTYCCGFTYAVAMRAAQQRGLLDDVSVEQARRFQKEWYGATGKTAEKQASAAVVNLGIGTEVSLDDARAGDFVNFVREGKTGHSVVLLRWIRRNGKIIGIQYRSSQPSTDGIGDGIEFLSDAGAGGEISPKRIYVARLNPGH